MNDKSYLANFSNGRYQNDCFCNTGVHILANCPAFRNYIMNLENNKIKNKPATRILKEIFSEMKTNAAHSFITDTFELKKELLHLDDGQQHDVFQFIEDLIGKLVTEEASGNEMPLVAYKDGNTKEDEVYDQHVRGSPILKLFTYLTEEKFHCEKENCENPNFSIFDAFQVLSVPLCKFKEEAGVRVADLDACISESFKNPYDPENIKKCPNSNCQADITGDSITSIIRTPPIALIRLTRSEFYGGEKNDAPIETKEHISLGNDFFKIKVIAIHDGPTQDVGHYYSYICQIDDWILANDEEVRKTTIYEREGTLKDVCGMVYLKQNASPINKVSERERPSLNRGDDTEPRTSTSSEQDMVKKGNNNLDN